MATIDIDNRGLPPPEPMVRILGALANAQQDDQIVALMDREPFPLYSELERRGWDHAMEEDGETYRLTIFKAADA